MLLTLIVCYSSCSSFNSENPDSDKGLKRTPYNVQRTATPVENITNSDQQR